MSEDFLDRIVLHKRGLVKKKKAFLEVIRQNVSSTQMTSYGLFKQRISEPGKINLIAEVKKASPSKGLICRDFDLMKIAKVYCEHDAAAISVLTEEKYFLGKPLYVRTVGENFNIPVLTKDFIIDENQIYEAFSFGTSAILLIVAILKDEELKRFLDVAGQLDMDVLVEVHSEAELERALEAGAEIIGINHRDLRTFEIDMQLSDRIIPMIPGNKVIVAESGIKSYEDVSRLKGLGANAVLIGETFLRAHDVGKKIDEVMQGVT